MYWYRMRLCQPLIRQVQVRQTHAFVAALCPGGKGRSTSVSWRCLGERTRGHGRGLEEGRQVFGKLTIGSIGWHLVD